MRIVIWLVAAAVLLISCEQADRPAQGEAGRSYSAVGGASLSPWLDHRKPVFVRELFSADAGSDIRQAALWQSAESGDPGAIVISRDYGNRVDGEADHQAVYRVHPSGPATMEDVTGLPLALVISPGRGTACLALLSQSGVGTFSQEQVTLVVWQGEQEAGRITLDSQTLPQAFLGEDAVQLRAVSSFQLEGGLLAPGFSQDSQAQVLQLPEMKIHTAGAIFNLNPSEDLAAVVEQSFDPADPGSGSMTISIVPWPRGGRAPLCDYGFPLHVSYSPFSWQPQLEWAGDDLVAALVFMPELAGEGRRESFHGLFRLVTLDCAGMVSLVEDHLSGDLPFHASSGLLFYTRRAAIADNQRWEVWASSPDGMYKRLIWSSADPVYISLEDAEAGSCLLLHVQDLKVTGSEVELVSRLLMLSLEPIAGAAPRDDGVEPGSARPAPPGSQPPPIAMPDNG